MLIYVDAIGSCCFVIDLLLCYRRSQSPIVFMRVYDCTSVRGIETNQRNMEMAAIGMQSSRNCEQTSAPRGGL